MTIPRRRVQTTTVYRVTAFRPRPGGIERVSFIRRQYAAAWNLADQLEEQGRGPVLVESAVIRKWHRVDREA